ncbi:hypothetical protein GOBAR_DD06787 [Gossypium barbadense]|nr:hypothetical protein GOBAR_DD06787 [Gossypium barbadense]
MKFVDDKNVETMVTLYCGNESDKNAPIHLFAELAGMEQNEDVNAYGEEHGAQEPYMVAPILYVDSESTIGGIDIDLNMTPDIDVVGDDGYDGSDHCDEEVDTDSDPDVDNVPDDIDDEDVNNDGNINASSVGYLDAKNVLATSRPDRGGTRVCQRCQGCNGYKLLVGEVPLTTFELVSDSGLRRNPRGHPQSSRIHNKIDIREKFDGKRCGLCRLSGHNQNKCPQRNYHVGQSSGSGRN